jgi:tetratricopeptide (TPR) repeat protein
MTRDEAMRLLEISREDHDPGVVHEAYTAQAAAVAQRVASAPTSALREKFQQQADRLRQARSLLLGNAHPQYVPGNLSLTKQRDLPARGPTATNSGRPAAPQVDNPLSLTQRLDLPARGPIATGPDASGEPEAGPAHPGVVTGQVLADRYEVRAALGSGGMGVVYAAFDRVRQEEIAVKVLLPHLLADPKARERFVNEAKIASNLSHPSIVRVYDIHQTPGLTFLTMERLRGRSLREELARRQQTAERFKVAEVLSIAEPLCEGLQYAHSQTVHRDVKPENVWLCEDGTVTLMDFGIARLLRPSQFTSTGLALGTAYYMAPEQLRGQEVDHRADQFALAVVLYELLTGEIPQGVIRPPHQLRRSVPASMSQAVMKSLEARPGDRHADMTALQRAMVGGGRGRRTHLGRKAVAVAVVVIAGACFAAILRPNALRGLWEKLAAESGAAVKQAARGPQPSHQELVAQAEFGSKFSQVAERIGEATRFETSLNDEAQKALDPTTRRRAERIASMWRKHRDREQWLTTARALLDGARKSSDDRSYGRAVEELGRAEDLLARPARWRQNARQALEATGQLRAALGTALSKQTDRPRPLAQWAEGLAGGVEAGLLREEGVDGLTEAERLAKHLPEYLSALEARVAAVGTASSRLFERVEGMRADLQAAEGVTGDADAALSRGELGEAKELYRDSARRRHQASEKAAAYLANTLANAEKARQAGRTDAAKQQYEIVLALRPRGAQADTELESARAAGIVPLITGALLGRARLDIIGRDIDAAIAAAEEAIRLAPDSADGPLARAEARAARYDLKGAEADAEEALRRDPKRAAAHLVLATAEMGRGDLLFASHEQRAFERSQVQHERAIAQCDEALRLDPRSARIPAWPRHTHTGRHSG